MPVPQSIIFSLEQNSNILFDNIIKHHRLVYTEMTIKKNVLNIVYIIAIIAQISVHFYEQKKQEYMLYDGI